MTPHICHEDLVKSCVEARLTPFKNHRFMPSHKAREFLSKESVKATLQEYFHETPPKPYDELVSYVMKDAGKVFLALAFSERVKQIGILFSDSFTDEDLPICKNDNWDISTLNDPRHSAWECFKHRKWSSAKKELFLSNQWIFLVPSFAKSQFSYTFPAEQPLPFVLLEDVSGDEGRFGLVCGVGILEGHHDYDIPNTSACSRPDNFKVALKNIKSEAVADDTVKRFYEREKMTLETMRKLNHPHLIKAAAAYERGTDRGFIFPWADGGNLLQFWMEDRTALNAGLLVWAVKQMTGLADGIEKLHSRSTRHGDIKPANIVIIKSGMDDRGNLVIADVGLAKFHATYTRERFAATTTKHGSRRYEPPEVQSTNAKFSRKYDVWSLGCIFFEFLIWILYGPQELAVFFSECADNVSDDRYWDTDSLRPVIEKWIDRLSSNLSQPCAWRDILFLIKTRLLVVVVNSRADSTEVLREMHKIQKNSLLDSSYAVGPMIHELTQDCQLTPSPDVSTDMSLSDNRTSKLRDIWESVTDNELARRIILRLQGSCPIAEPSSSTLCSSCQNIDLRVAIIDLNRNIDEIRHSASTCDFCRLLNYCISKKNITYAGPLQLFRDGSILSVSRKGPPLISIYSKFECNRTVPSYAQIGLPKLPEIASPQQFQLLKEWIRLCDETHECFRTEGDIIPSTRMPTRVVDVGSGDNPCLRLVVPSDTLKEKYTALSHCWGKNLTFVMGKSNIDQFMLEISFNELPRTFQDAVRTTRALGIRYLWIDSLCIVQDDENDWNKEAKKMEDVYSCAYVTIAASSAASSLDGFLVDRLNRAPARIVTPDGPLYLADAIDNFVGDVDMGILNTRGWVLQERALSRRIIHFTSTQIYWECGMGVHCETLAQMRNVQSQFLGDPDFPRLALAYFKNERIRLVQHLYTLYCALRFTKASDRSVAISGLLRRLSRAFQTRVDYGLFWKYFERLILWRARPGGSLLQIEYANDNFVPSWSWMAYSGEIEYPEVPFGKVKWTGDLCNPFPTESQDGTCEPILVAKARKLTIGDPDLRNRVTLDRNLWPEFERGQWRCVVVGMEKIEDPNIPVPHYALLIHPSLTEQSYDVYERIGVGILTPGHFSIEAEEVRLI
ncbi:hypothetical protein F4680DRAFT_471994 [Xylaria scruposa]|nr:hypothetical protein F4680DRAFT_471994 [Xylaria scruposa]